MRFAAKPTASIADAPLVALLRGVNVGGNNKLAMRDLVAVFESLGCRDVRTYIQSGNVVARAPASAVDGLSDAVAKALCDNFGLTVPVVLRRGDALAAVVADNPYLAAGADPTTLHVMFLRDAPSAAQVAALDPARSPGDAYAVRGRDVFLHCPNGLARTKLTNDYFDRTLATVSTVRNWKTVLTLLAMTQSP
jgi:uncharacterized protein (DUF1697 family)